MKVSDSYQSLLRGVSQQVPQNRASGQHAEQINMLADPVNGLTRRHGSTWLAEKSLSGASPGELATYLADTASYRSLDWDTGGKEYAVLYRTAARPAGATEIPGFVVYNKTDKQFLSVVSNAGDTPLNFLLSNGVSAITPVGKYLFATAKGVPVTGTSTNRWDDATNIGRTVVWVRGGAFSRKFSVTVTKADNTRASISWTSPSSSYQGVLDTSDILTADPDYTKKVNDRVNAYNAAVTQWIGTSTAAVQPENIAEQLKVALGSIAGVTAARLGSHVYLTGVKSLEVDDGGNGELIRGVADEVGSVDQVSAIHHVGKVVKVRSRNASEAFYLKAVAKDKSVATGYTEVTWVEGAGVEHAITGGLFYATVVGSNFYIASSATLLNAITAGDHPTFTVSAAGDSDSAPKPFFVGREVTYLSTFQNRLLVGCGGVLAVSKTDDYLNFFRSTVLTTPASDPFEMLPQGSEADVLRASTLYNRDLVVFGDKRQYVVNGSVALTPTSANMAVLASYEDAATCQPLAAGGYIFYAKNGEQYTSLYQIQPGQTDDSPESFPASSQIDRYLTGNAVEMTVNTGSPSIVFLRTTGARNSVYTFAYLDKPDGRKMDAWSRWDFNPALGATMGQSSTTDGLVLFTLRVSGSAVYVVADFCPTTTGLAATPYLDSQRPYSVVAGGTTSLLLSSGPSWVAAYNSTSARRFTGVPLPDVADLLAAFPGEPGMVVGAENSASVEPTNPYLRDKNDQAILSGRLTITKLLAAYRQSTGLSWALYYRNQLVNNGSFNGRVLGDPNNLIGYEPISDGQYSLPVGKETRDYRIVLSARKWYPFTLTALEWVGQYFNRTYRG